MGAVMSRVAMPAGAAVLTLSLAAGMSYHQSTSGVGTNPFATTYNACKEVVREAADAAFHAIARAGEAAASYISALSSKTAAKGYEFVISAGAEASRRVVALIDRICGSAAAQKAKGILDGIVVPINIGDVSNVVNCIVDVIKGIVSGIVEPVASAAICEASPMEKLARSSTLRVTRLLTGIKATENLTGKEIPVPVKVVIGMLAVVGELAQAVNSLAETSMIAQ